MNLTPPPAVVRGAYGLVLPLAPVRGTGTRCWCRALGVRHGVEALLLAWMARRLPTHRCALRANAAVAGALAAAGALRVARV